MTRPPLAFVAVCNTCGKHTEPCPAEGEGESWKTAEQWLFLALQDHRPKCQGPTRKAAA